MENRKIGFFDLVESQDLGIPSDVNLASDYKKKIEIELDTIQDIKEEISKIASDCLKNKWLQTFDTIKVIEMELDNSISVLKNIFITQRI